jgi:putative zinc finger/helix-turn-helix YgiT family protein
MKKQRLPTGAKCPECGQGRLVSHTRTEEFDFDLGDETVKVRAKNVPIQRCDRCAEVISGPAAAKVRHEAICRAAGLLTPAEIKALREEFGWLQETLADLTGFGVATVSRWERGRLLQNRSNNKVLLALRDCPPFREYLATSSRRKLGGKNTPAAPRP